VIYFITLLSLYITSFVSLTPVHLYRKCPPSHETNLLGTILRFRLILHLFPVPQVLGLRSSFIAFAAPILDSWTNYTKGAYLSVNCVVLVFWYLLVAFSVGFGAFWWFFVALLVVGRCCGWCWWSCLLAVVAVWVSFGAVGFGMELLGVFVVVLVSGRFLPVGLTLLLCIGWVGVVWGC